MFKRFGRANISDQDKHTHPFNMSKDLTPKDPMEELRTSVGPWTLPNTKTPKSFLQNLTAETIIHEGVNIKGELSFQTAIRIDGTFEGTIHSEGSLHVGPTGIVRSDLNLKSAIIEGMVEGNISVSETLELRSTAEVRGDMSAKSFKVEEGATLMGIVSISSKNND